MNPGLPSKLHFLWWCWTCRSWSLFYFSAVFSHGKWNLHYLLILGTTPFTLAITQTSMYSWIYTFTHWMLKQAFRHCCIPLYIHSCIHLSIHQLSVHAKLHSCFLHAGTYYGIYDEFFMLAFDFFNIWMYSLALILIHDFFHTFYLGFKHCCVNSCILSCIYSFNTLHWFLNMYMTHSCVHVSIYILFTFVNLWLHKQYTDAFSF